MVLSSWPKSLQEFTRFIWWMQTKHRVATNPPTKPINLGCESAKNWPLLSTPTITIVIITHFTIPQRAEGWVYLSTAIKVHSQCPRLYIAAAVATNRIVHGVIQAGSSHSSLRRTNHSATATDMHMECAIRPCQWLSACHKVFGNVYTSQVQTASTQQDQRLQIMHHAENYSQFLLTLSISKTIWTREKSPNSQTVAFFKKSGHSNLTQGNTAITHGLSNNISQVAPMCTLINGSLAHTGLPPNSIAIGLKRFQSFFHSSLVFAMYTDRYTLQNVQQPAACIGCMWHTHTRLTALCPGLPRWAGTTKVKPIWILLEQETVSGTGIGWAICKSAPRTKKITMPAPHHSVFTGWMPFLPPNQQCQSTEGIWDACDVTKKIRKWQTHSDTIADAGVGWQLFVGMQPAIWRPTDEASVVRPIVTLLAFASPQQLCHASGASNLATTVAILFQGNLGKPVRER